MRRAAAQLRLLTLVGALTAVAACQKGDKWAEGPPPAGSLTAIEHPVGPIPGPGNGMAQPANPYRDAQSLQAGRTLFVRFNCSGCHGGRGGGGMGPSLRDKDWIYGNSDAAIFDSIAQGRAHGMPAWGTQLPQQQIWQLVAYVQSLGTDDEPAKPTQEHADEPPGDATE
jgi:cytochrome c oxidase cbb3-type subunit 3